MKLYEVIKQQISKNGPISFHDFMEAALYYPNLGYYMRAGQQIGKGGDFYTSCTLGPVFGAMIGKQVEEMWRLTGGGEFTVVEFGAGTGALCKDILNYLKDNRQLYDQFHYAIIEKSHAMRQTEKSHLTEKVTWYNNIRELGEITGCILSNELIDNFAVHRVIMEEELMEVFIDYREGFVELLRPAGIELKNYLAELNVSLPKGFQTEINLEATGWLEEISKCLGKGYILTIDYGYSSDEFYKPCRSRGTLLCYHKHTINDYYYQHIGEQDITAHVNFSALCHWGDKFGLSSCGLTNQAHFLLALGFKDYLRNNVATTGNIIQKAMEETRLTRTLLVDMGYKFKVLIQRKGIQDFELSGMNYSLPDLKNTTPVSETIRH